MSFLSAAIFQNAKLHVLHARILADIFRLPYRITSISDGARVVGEKPDVCNSTGEISSTYFPITLADLDSNGIENILIVRLHG